MISELTKFYKNKRILVTGHTGFKGGWLSLWLNNLGSKVCGYSINPPSIPNFYETIELKNIIDDDVFADILDFENLLEAFRRFEPEIVFHLAAQPIVIESFNSPRQTYMTNVMGTVNVLEASRLCSSVKTVIVVTSDKCYENKEWNWSYREGDVLGGIDPYSSSKSCAELVAKSYIKSFFCGKGIKVTTARAGNVLGGGDWGQFRLVPDIVRSIYSDKPVILRNPDAVRPWQFVLDPIYGYLLLAKNIAETSDLSEGWNFGPTLNKILTVEQITKKIIGICGKGEYTIENNNINESKYLNLDCTKANMKLHWYSKYNIEETLSETIEWYNMFYDSQKNGSMYDFSVKQIDKFYENNIELD